MAKKFKLPDLGEGIHEGEVLAVRVSVGDEVKEGHPILEVETDKAAVEIPSPYTGTVLEIMVKPGDLVKVGQVMMAFSEGPTRERAAKPSETRQPPDARFTPTPPPKAAALTLLKRDTGPVPASPATRRLARELGVDLRGVTASGPAGLVTADDVRSFAQTVAAKPETVPDRVPAKTPPPAETALPPATDAAVSDTWGPVRRVALRSIRRATAKQMTLAWSRIPHVTSQDTVDITKLEKFRQRHKAGIKSKGAKLTLTTFALKAALTALKAYPRFNASLDQDAEEILLKQYFHIGVAVDTPDGLIVPVLRDVDQKSISELAVELSEVADRTRERRISLEELQGGTFTITNIGSLGGGHFTPIINYPQVAILGMGGARWQPAVVESETGERQVKPRLMMPIVLAIDHRVLDGADAIRFLRVVTRSLSDPEDMLLTMI